MKQHLYVGNLPLDYTEEQLKSLFTGTDREVESVTIRVKAKTGRSRGFGFVKMASESDAESALTALNGSDVGGRSLKVGEAFRETRDRPVSRSYDDYRPSRPKRKR